MKMPLQLAVLAFVPVVLGFDARIHCVPSTIGLRISFRHPPGGADLFDIQLGLGGGPRFLSQTSSSSPALIHDLIPDTNYTVTVRHRARSVWSSFASPVSCRTKPLGSKAWVLPPQHPPTPTTITVSLGPGASGVAQHRCVGCTAWSGTQVSKAGLVLLQGLSPGTSYDIRAGAEQRWSDPVRHRTANPSTEHILMYRISEMCDGDTGVPCEVDLLHNHDSGQLMADVDFITEMAAFNGSGFIGDFNNSITTAYCVERVHEPFADYVSCNGNTTESYECICNNWIDRCLGRMDTSVCNASEPDPQNPHIPACHCSSQSLDRSSRVIGRMPVYTPFASFQPPAPHSDPTECHYPSSPMHKLGYWYSMPAGAECDPISTGGLLQNSSCSWARQATQQFVKGQALARLGFNTSQVLDLAELEQNSQTIEQALDMHPTRCCGC